MRIAMNADKTTGITAAGITAVTMMRITAACLMGLLLLGSCAKKDDSLLSSMFDIEARSMKGAPPSTVEELRAAIAQYGEEVEKTVAAHEQVGNYWRLLAVKYMERGLFGEAYEAALKALNFYPTNSGLYYVAGLSAAFLSRTALAEYGGGQTTREGWLKASEGAYKESIRLDERNTRSLYGLAVVYSFELEDHEAAIPLLERMLGIDTMNMDALFLYARSLYGAGRMQDAVDVYDRIIAGSKIEERRDQAAANKKQILDELYVD
ncbi:MAG: tetratricopeptide repeat protein [Clostridia bacterium]